MVSFSRHTHDLSESVIEWILIGLIGIFVGILLVHAGFREIHSDEIEAVHSAWLVREGLVPYRDFFQHHHPVFYYFLAPLIGVFGESAKTILFLRMVMMVFAAGIVVATAGIARRVCLYYETYMKGSCHRSPPISAHSPLAHSALIGGPPAVPPHYLLFHNAKAASLLAVAFLLSTVLFVLKVVEIRPDVPQVCFSLWGIYFFLRFWQEEQKRFVFWSGVCVGIGFLFLQKAVFVGIPLVVFFVVRQLGYVLKANRCGREKERGYEIFERERVGPLRLAAKKFYIPSLFGWFIRNEIFLFFFGLCIPLIPFVVWITQQIGWSEYMFLNWILNLHYLDTLIPFDVIDIMGRFNFFLLIAAGLGIFFAPLQRLLGGKERTKNPGLISLDSFSVLVVLGFCIFIEILFVRVAYWHYFVMVLPFVAVYAAVFVVRLGALRRWGMLAAVLVVVVPPFITLLWMSVYYHDFERLEKIDYVLSLVPRGERVHDGVNYLNVFRPDMDYFWFSLADRQALATYRLARPYAYDMDALIRERRPKVVLYVFKNESWLYQSGEYAASPKYYDILIRKE